MFLHGTLFLPSELDASQATDIGQLRPSRLRDLDGKWTIYCSTNKGRRVCETYIGGYEQSSWPETTQVLVSPAVHFPCWSIAHGFADSLTRAASRLASGVKVVCRSAGLGFGIESHRPRNSSGSARHGRACMTRVLPRAFSLPSNAHALEAARPLAIFPRRPRLGALKTQRARCRPGPTVMQLPSVRPATSRSICGLQPADPCGRSRARQTGRPRRAFRSASSRSTSASRSRRVSFSPTSSVNRSTSAVATASV